MTASRLKSLQSRYGEAIDREIKSHLAARDDGHGFYTMMGYQFGYVDARLQPVASAGGKRFRPVLCLLACEAVRGSWETALPVAASVELLHNFSLIHDDIEDRDPERRHQPAVWKLWGEPKAINVGDGMFALASRVIMETRQEPATAVDLARGLHETALQLTEGQNMDMACETQQEVTVDEYRAMIGRKTGALIAFSLWSGAIVGGTDEETREALRRFGAELGSAFQIYDDIMGVWGTSDVTGKEAAKDLHNRKKTLPILLAMARATEPQATALQTFFSAESDDLAAVLTVLEETGAQARSRKSLAEHLSNAVAVLRYARITHEARDDMCALAHELTGQLVPSS